MSEVVRAAIAGAALLYLFVLCMAWILWFIATAASAGEVLRSYPRRRDRLVFRFISVPPIAVVAGGLAYSFGLAWVRP